jgi:hypothetical protein
MKKALRKKPYNDTKTMFESKTDERDKDGNNIERIPISEMNEIVARIRSKIRKNIRGKGVEKTEMNNSEN